VISRAKRLLDERLDAVGATARDTLRARLAIACAVVLLTLAVIGPGAATAWGTAFGLGELATRLAVRPLGRGEALSRRRRAAYLAGMGFNALVWSSAAAIYWLSGETPFRLAAMAILAGQLVHAQSFAFRSPAALAALGLPPATLWLVLPVALGGYRGLELVVLFITFALMLAYVAAGRLVGYYEPHMRAWDCMAGYCLVKEAGGTHLPFPAEGEALLQGYPVLASNRTVYADLLAIHTG
jgi:hypothetical protein